MKINTSNKKILIIGVLVLLLSGGLYYKIEYEPNNLSLEAQRAKYEKNPDLLATQDVLTKTDKMAIKEAEKRPLLSYLPYDDGYIYISTSQSSYHLLVQYTTTLADANKQYDNLLKKYGDTGRHYDVKFRKVITLVKE